MVINLLSEWMALVFIYFYAQQVCACVCVRIGSSLALFLFTTSEVNKCTGLSRRRRETRVHRRVSCYVFYSILLNSIDCIIIFSNDVRLYPGIVLFNDGVNFCMTKEWPWYQCNQSHPLSNNSARNVLTNALTVVSTIAMPIQVGCPEYHWPD